MVDETTEKIPFTLPRPDQRVLILGSNGSGKTVLGANLLSVAAFDQMPYVMIDYKRDELLNSIDRRREIGLTDIPNHPGLYHLKPNPVSDDDKIEEWLLKVWAKRNIGLYVDEALRLPTKRTGAFQTILTQGRALHIPVISLSQRPVDLNRYAFSEANHVIVMRLTDMRDRKKVTEFVPIAHDYRLKKYNFIWYNVDHNFQWSMPPSEHPNKILERFHERLKPKRNLL